MLTSWWISFHSSRRLPRESLGYRTTTSSRRLLLGDHGVAIPHDLSLPRHQVRDDPPCQLARTRTSWSCWIFHHGLEQQAREGMARPGVESLDAWSHSRSSPTLAQEPTWP